MGKYDAYLVCEKGHGINNSYYSSPEFNKKFCTTCGSKTFKECPNCGSDIQGKMHFENIIDLSGGIDYVPEICKNCGKDFPWKTEKKEIVKNINSLEKDNIILIENLMDKFHLVAKQLRQRYNERETLDIKDEYDVQDLFQGLLRIYYEDIRAEEWNPSYAGGSSRSDFLLKDEKIIIEVKKTRSTLKSKQLGEQLIVDIAKYKTHPDCKTLICFVYDPEGYIINPKGIENDLNKESTKEMKVIVKIIPKGH